jgi:hypothetical protein
VCACTAVRTCACTNRAVAYSAVLRHSVVVLVGLRKCARLSPRGVRGPCAVRVHTRDLHVSEGHADHGCAGTAYAHRVVLLFKFTCCAITISQMVNASHILFRSMTTDGSIAFEPSTNRQSAGRFVLDVARTRDRERGCGRRHLCRLNTARTLSALPRLILVRRLSARTQPVAQDAVPRCGCIPAAPPIVDRHIEGHRAVVIMRLRLVGM